MDFILSKGRNIYTENDTITSMESTLIPDMVATESRYNAEIEEADTLYQNGEITLAEREERVKKATFDRQHNLETINVYNQRSLDLVKLHPAGYKEEQGFLTGFNSLDFEISNDKSDFEVKISRENSLLMGIELGDFIYSPGTEYGGIIDGRKVNTSSSELIWTGTTWRGLIEKDIIRPLNPKLDPFRVVSGDANSIIRTILWENSGTGTFFSVPSEPSDVSYTNWQFHRYTNKLFGLSHMLEDKGYKLKIWAEGASEGGQFIVWVKAVPIENYSQELEYSQDEKSISMNIEQNFNVPNHLICLGDGELTARTVIELWVNSAGEIVTKKPTYGYFGIYERTEIYDYKSIEGETTAQKTANLRKAGIDKLKELYETENMDLTVGEIEVEIGDIVGGKDRTTGLTMSKAITKKILRVDAKGTESVQLSVERNEGMTDAID